MTPVASLHEKGDCEITIGTGSECDIALSDPVFQAYLSDRHACLKRRGRRYYVKDLRSAQGTFVNGFKVGRRWVRIALHDDVYLGKCPFKVAGLILKAQQVSLQARHLGYSIAGKGGCRRTLVADVSFKVEPGELVGILGPSGAGKTVLLNLLSGALRPAADAHGASGFVTVNDRFVLHKEKDLLKDFIGFVPQDDILIPELTVAQSLAYSLELKYCDSGIERGFKQRRIDATLEKLGFAGGKRSDFLNTPIGSSDTRRGLSGGERRRANIAQELIKNPLLLFLDEPTSGLSSVDADHIVGLLRKLSQVDRTTVITTIHQPSAASFSLFDKVLILNHGGKLAYFGPPDKAVAHFEAQSGAELGNRNPAEFILETLDRWSLSETPETVFLATEAVTNGLPETSWSPPAEDVHTVSRGTVRGGLRQFLTLLRRHLSVARADRGNMWFLLLQPLLVAGLIILCFFGYQDDYRSQTRDERIVFHVVQKSGQGLRLTRQNLQKASTWADAPQNRGYLSFGAANRLGAIYFLLIVTAIWIGIINTCREIVGEKAILRREGGTYLRMSAYLLSKWVFFALLSALQVGLIVVAVRAGLVPGMPGLFFWGILSLTSACATCIGLALSGLVGSQRMALTAVPLVLIPQLLFGGLVRPVRYLSSGFDWIHHLMLQKWAFFASLLGGDHLGVRVLSKMTDFSNYDVTRRLVYHQESLAEMYFGAVATAPHQAMATALTVMAGQGLVVLLLAYLVLRIKYAR